VRKNRGETSEGQAHEAQEVLAQRQGGGETLGQGDPRYFPVALAEVRTEDDWGHTWGVIDSMSSSHRGEVVLRLIQQGLSKHHAQLLAQAMNGALVPTSP
jgi:hypothetical protein